LITILLETAGVVALGLIGVTLGSWFARRRSPWWLLGYLLPLTVIVLIGLAHRLRPLELHPPFSWLMAGRTEFAVFALVGTMVLTTPLRKLPNVRDRIAVTLLMIVVVGQISVMPFLAPAWNRAQLMTLTTQIDADGICRQGTDYTCGPAAAVTLLRRMGVAAEEGELALLCRTSAFMGTPPDLLARRLQSRYGSEGVTATYRSFRSVAELGESGPTLALVKFSLFLDHYVAVLEVGGDTLTVGDPLLGKTILGHEDFEKRWRRVGVVLEGGYLPCERDVQSGSGHHESEGVL
jgi:predicted double-glycine peptidase